MTTPKSPEDDVVFYRSTGDISIESNGLSDMFPGLFKNMQPKSPDEICQQLYLTQAGLSIEKIIESEKFLRSSMSSLLCYMAERMKTDTFQYPYEDRIEYLARLATSYDCRTLLIEEARKIGEREAVINGMRPLLLEERIRQAAKESAEDQNKMLEEARKITEV